MTAFDRLRRDCRRLGRWGLSNSLTRTLTSVLGLRGRFHTWYWQRQFRRHDGMCSRSVDGTPVDFHTTTPEEFRHCRTLMGEDDILDDLVTRIEPDDVFFDIGAYVGVYTCVVSAQRPSATVVAFEPDPQKRDGLARNIETNGFEADVSEYVISNEAGTVAFATSRAPDGPNVSRIATENYDDTIEVPMVTMDDLVSRGAVPAPSVVKLDVEGGEFDALQGMETILGGSSCRLVYCEVHPTLLPSYGATEDGVHALLERAGFELTRIASRGEEYFLRGERRSTEQASGRA